VTIGIFEKGYFTNYIIKFIKHIVNSKAKIFTKAKFGAL